MHKAPRRRKWPSGCLALPKTGASRTRASGLGEPTARATSERASERRAAAAAAPKKVEALVACRRWSAQEGHFANLFRDVEVLSTLDPGGPSLEHVREPLRVRRGLRVDKKIPKGTERYRPLPKRAPARVSATPVRFQIPRFGRIAESQRTRAQCVALQKHAPSSPREPRTLSLTPLSND